MLFLLDPLSDGICPNPPLGKPWDIWNRLFLENVKSSIFSLNLAWNSRLVFSFEAFPRNESEAIWWFSEVLKTLSEEGGEFEKLISVFT